MSEKNKKKEEIDKGENPEKKQVAPAFNITKEEVDALMEKAKKSEEYHDKWLRACADGENTRKRLQKEKEEFIRFANEDLILRLLPIVDNFDRATVSVKHTPELDAVLKGIKLVQKELHSLFKDFGVEVIESVGKKFDPHLHEAIAVVETNEHEEDTIVEEIQAGYTLNGRLVRPCIVKVSKKKQEDKKGD